MYHLNEKKNKKGVGQIADENKNKLQIITFSRQWLRLDKCEFGTLAAIIYLSEDGTTFTGRVSDICKFVGISTQTKNAAKRKQCIESLAQKGILAYQVNKKTYTINVTNDIAETDCIHIYQDEILITKNCKLEGKSVAWEKVLKTWIFLAGNRKEIITTKEIAAAINEKEWGIYPAKAILKCANLIDYKTKYDILEHEDGTVSFMALGQQIDPLFCFDREPWKGKLFKEIKSF